MSLNTFVKSPSLSLPAALAVAWLATGCVSLGGTKSDTAAAPAAAPAPAAAAAPAGPKIGPGMNANGEVVNSKLVEAGYGQKVKGLDDWEGEITGKPRAGSKFANLKIGMSAQQVLGMLGQPDDQGSHPTGKAFIPFYFGSDKYRYEVVYRGQGRLIFSSGAAFAWGGSAHLTWIIHNANEGTTR
jgi:hypothetical protein